MTPGVVVARGPPARTPPAQTVFCPPAPQPVLLGTCDDGSGYRRPWATGPGVATAHPHPVCPAAPLPRCTHVTGHRHCPLTFLTRGCIPWSQSLSDVTIGLRAVSGTWPRCRQHG